MGIDTGIKPGAQGNYSRDNAGASGVVVKGDDDAILARDDDTRVARVYLESLGMKLCAYDQRQLEGSNIIVPAQIAAATDIAVPCVKQAVDEA